MNCQARSGRAARAGLVLLALITTCGTPARAAPAGPQPPQALQAPLQIALAGQSLRAALDAIRQASGQVYWLERRVDPGQEVSVPLAGPTVADAFDQVARSAGLVTLPVGGILLVGRAAWVDRVGALPIPAGDADQAARPPADPSIPPIQWPMLTTPTEALRIVTQPMGLAAADRTLPHDLWPAVRIPAIHRTTVLTLIGAEFDLWIAADPLRRRLQVRSLPEQTAVVRDYPATVLTAAVRQAARQIDPQIRFAPSGAEVQVRSLARTHHWIDRRTAVDPPPGNPPPPGADRQRFTLRLENVPAGRVLATLAAAGNWTLQVDPEATESCQRLVTLTAEDARLIEIVRQVVRQVGLAAEPRGAVLHIGAP